MKKNNREVAFEIFGQMQTEGIDLIGWRLAEVPIDDEIYVFDNCDLKQCFTVEQDKKGKLTYHYVLAWKKGMEYNCLPATSIVSAIAHDESWIM